MKTQVGDENADPATNNIPTSGSDVCFTRETIENDAEDINQLLLREFRTFRNEFNSMKERQAEYENHVDRVMQVQMRNDDERHQNAKNDCNCRM